MKAVGTIQTGNDWEIARLMGLYAFVEWKNEVVTLRSGRKTHVYVKGRNDFTDHPDLMWFVGRKLAELVRENSQHNESACLIGLPAAGAAFSQAATMVAWAEKIRTCVYGPPGREVISYRLMREVPKKHGLHQKWIAGDYDSSKTFWRVDNTVTDGGTKLDFESKFADDGYPTIHTNPDQAPFLILVDRQQGGIQRMKDLGATRVVRAYDLLDLVSVFKEIGVWSEAQRAAVEQEIAQNQVL